MAARALAVSLLLAVCATQLAAQTIMRVTPSGAGVHSGADWDNAMTLPEALAAATAGDEVWVQGFEVIDEAGKVYTLTGRDDAFTVKSGVKVYGGFKGDETSIDQRETLGKRSEMRHRTVLSGDVMGDDELDATNLIFPGNSLRSDNARHVVVIDLTPTQASGNNNTLPTVLDGLSIADGQADGDAATADGHGGGALIMGDNTLGGAFMITNCFFVNNYARRGGAVHVDGSVVLRPTESVISYCTVFNNAAGERSSANNSGGGLWLEGDCTVVNCEVFNNENGGIAIAEGASVVNSTVARNTGSGIERIGDGEAFVRNTVIWGNTYLYASASPMFYNSAYHEVVLADGESEDANHNRYVSNRNRGNDVAVPMFESPSLRTSYDREFDWRTMAYPLWSWDIQDGSAFIDGGDDTFYGNTYGTVDMAGDVRRVGTVDIGAYEYQTVSASRIRYVDATNGSDVNDGQQWASAYRSVQHAIDDLAATPGVRGEVWVAAGTYYPTAYLEDNPAYPASFRMVDGISVYGGFAGWEENKNQRERVDGGLPWQFVNKTELCGVTYDGTCEWNATDRKWSVNSGSTHVVWFAPLLNEGKDDGFDHVTLLDGVTIRGGQATTSQAPYYYGDRGAGVYMARNAYLTNSVVTENTAAGNGGAVYLDGGRVMSSLINNNSSEAQGGGIYVDNAGIVLRSMIANNSAYQGGGVYLDSNGEWTDGLRHPEYLILSTCVVSNNTSSANGAVYCNNGGIILQSTITNNDTPRATDLTDDNASRTGGLYIDTYGLVVNSVLWNNKLHNANINAYVKNPSTTDVRFLNMAVSSMNNVVWNNVITEAMLPLADANTTVEGQVSPDFAPAGQMADDNALISLTGVQPEWKSIDFYWKPVAGSNLRTQGAVLGTLPDEVLLEPEQDLSGNVFEQKPAIGAWEVQTTPLNPETDGNTLRLYVDIECTDPTHDGSSWATAYRSLNEAIEYFAGLPASDVADKQLEIRVKEGDLFPIYAFGNLDPQTAHLAIKKTNSRLPLRIIGGWDGTDGGAQDPLTHRTLLDGNLEDVRLEDGLYHVIVAEPEANVVLDGFHVVGGYAAGTATITSGAGMIIYDGATVEVRNCIFENNTATECAAIDGRQQGVSLTLVNTVVGNNTNINNGTPVIAAANLTLNHVTMVNNEGYAPSVTYTNSFAVGNTGGNTLSLASTGEGGTANFRNPSNAVGATLGFDTYYGGYSDYTPLTSSSDDARMIINQGQATGVTNDLAMNGRDLGGKPDLGAYEAELPEAGRVYYVRTPQDGGSDSNSGLSWDEAFATVRHAVDAASRTAVIDGEKAQVWVAAGTYRQNPENGSDNCFEIVDGVNVYGAFPRTGAPSMDDRRPFISDEVWYDDEGGTISTSDYETVLRPVTTTQSGVRRVLGQPDEYNPFSSNRSYQYVGEGNGDYVNRRGEYYPSEGGGYYYSSSGNEYVEANPDVADYNGPGYSKYYTRNDRITAYSHGGSRRYFVEVGDGFGRYTISSSGWRVYTDRGQGYGNYAEFTSAGYYECSPDIEGAVYHNYEYVGAGRGEYVYAQEAGRYYHVGAGYGDYAQYTEDHYENVGAGNGDYVLTGIFSYPTRWDGFTIRDGFIDSDQISFLDGNGKRNGGAGAAIFTNVTLANCIVTGNTNLRRGSGDETRAGGIYCDEGTLVNCYVLGNTLGDSNDQTGYGAGVYMYNGTAYNCVISGNVGNAQHSDGAGIFIENAIFFNNTIVGNSSNGGTRGAGGICIWNSGGSAELIAYNCISIGNTMRSIGENVGNKDVAANGGAITCFNSIFETTRDVSQGSKSVTYDSSCISLSDRGYNSGTYTSIFENASAGNYRLAGNGAGSIAINQGENEPVINGTTYFLMDYTDMDFTARIKDCAIDAGAYEYEQTTATPSYDYETGTYVYYVTQNGSGTASGESPANAACATKLQVVLNAAGNLVRTSGQTVTVRVAGYPEGEGGFVYAANSLSDADDPQSYAFTIPYGVVVEGGWDEGFTARDVVGRPTRFSPVAMVGGVVVNGYHSVVFSKPDDGQTDRKTVVDGLFLQDGHAVSASGSGSPDARGGGAVVPSWAHVRNCVVTGNEAILGGGLYVEPGGLVSGTLVYGNVAEEGAGIYAARADSDGAEVTAGTRAHVISATVTDNTSSSTGGGIYLEDDAAMVLNSIVWGNDAPSDMNVSGALYDPIADDLLSRASGETIDAFYPFNNCFVETYEMPGNFANTSLESGASAEEKYFAGKGIDRTLKEYSPMVKHGTVVEIMDFLQDNIGVAANDMQGIARVQTGMDKADAGAFAFNGGAAELPVDINDVATRLFVSQTQNVKLRNGADEARYRGKSFYTSFTWLDDALLYVQTLRDNPDLQGQRNDEGKTIDEIEFEILVANGTYKPHYRRVDAASTTADQRQNSFDIPQGVRIYGGFSGTESESFGGIVIPSATGDIATNHSDIEMLASSRELSDLNGNGVQEAWELAKQTILSGEVNTSSLVGNVYHVVYSDKRDVENPNPIVLDGLTVNYGETANTLSAVVENDEVGRGAGIYSNGVDYVIKGCRILNCKAVRGGALYARDADVLFLSSMVAGNGTVDNPDAGELDVRGGAVYVAGINAPSSLKAVNTVFANNETTGKGGAIAITDRSAVTNYPVTVDLMNTTFVRNAAGQDFSAIYAQQVGCSMKNSVLWGNAATANVFSPEMNVTYTASDQGVEAGDGNHNVALGTTNLAVDGPRFKNPSMVMGVAGNTSAAFWNPAAISVLTDVGDGQLEYQIPDITQATGSYKDWMQANAADYQSFYMKDPYKRYAGPAPVDEGSGDPKVIDLGAYEYQYESNFSRMDTVYVDVIDHGNASGGSWENATSDFRGALAALSNADGIQYPNNMEGRKVIMMRGGDYAMSQLGIGGIMYNVNMSGDENIYSRILTVRGSYDETGDQDFSKPTRIIPNPAVDGQTNTLVSLNVNGKEVNLVGLSFEDARQQGVYATNSVAGGSLSFRNVAFRDNAVGASLRSADGTSNLFVNALFANGGTGLEVDGTAETRVVNATFANNTTAIAGTADAVNSISWRSGTGLVTDAAKCNHDFGEVDNTDLNNGPNFVSPETGDYSIRPSITVIEAGSSDLYHEMSGTVASDDNDLGGAPRVTGAEIDLGAYEYDAELKQVLYVRAGVAGGDGSGSDWNNPIADLQGAIDLASVYHNKNVDKDGYVFVHNNVTVSDAVRLVMPGVRVYGGMTTVSTEGTPDDVLARRGCFLGYASKSSLRGGLSLGAGSVIDGFSIDGAVSVDGDAMLSTSVVEPTAVVTLGDGVLYNSYVGGAVTGVGEVVNVTTPNDFSSEVVKKNVCESAVVNGYVADDVWNYQLREDNPLIDGGDTPDISRYIALAGHDKDLSAARRVRGAVDGGCFETWFISSAATATADDCPTGSHVVYVAPGQELTLAEGLTSDASPFDAGFLLLQHGAGLFGNGNWIDLDNFAIERTLDAAGGYWDLAYAPFTVARTTVDGVDYVAGGSVDVRTYDGARRASYDYRFSATDGAWVDAMPAGYVGLLFEATDKAEHKVRLYGNAYVESPDAEKSVRLYKYNYSEPWASPDEQSDRFTHMENMSWNTFGSPFLCGMNYGDMEYGRVIYKRNGDAFAAVNTMDEQSSEGSIEAGAAVFTQTATLADEERVDIALRQSPLQGVGTRSGNLAVELSSDAAGKTDEIVLTAVPTDEALSTFDISGDGVKMMSVDTTAAQIYMERGGNRYSLLSAVDVEGTVGVGLHLDAAGSYAIGIPADCPAYDYETVVLTDKACGRVVDLLDTPYPFNVGGGGEVEGRFTLQFNRALAGEGSGITVYSDSNGDVIVDGLAVGMRVRVYDTSGRMIANRVAAAPTETFTECERGVCLVQVIDGDTEPMVFKVRVDR